MSEHGANSQRPSSKLTQRLFNPFLFTAGSKALTSGIAAILLAGLFGWMGNTHFDGIIDVHTGTEAPLWCFMAEGLIDWISMAIPLVFFGLIVSNSTFRLIDVLGTQALARWPYLITSLAMLPAANRRVNAYLLSRFSQGQAAVTASYNDFVIFAVAMIVTVCMAVWTVALMYKGYSLSCNVKGPRAIITFIISFVGAEVLSKAAVMYILS